MRDSIEQMEYNLYQPESQEVTDDRNSKLMLQYKIFVYFSLCNYALLNKSVKLCSETSQNNQ